MQTSDDLKNIDPGENIRGSVGEDGAQMLETVRTTDLLGRGGRVMRERICKDNFGNEYLVYHAVLPDGEAYEVSDWVRPSVLVRYGGWTDALLDDFRARAQNAFAVACVHGKREHMAPFQTR